MNGDSTTSNTFGVVIVVLEWAGIVVFILTEMYFTKRRERSNRAVLDALRRYQRDNIPPWDGEAI